MILLTFKFAGKRDGLGEVGITSPKAAVGIDQLGGEGHEWDEKQIESMREGTACVSSRGSRQRVSSVSRTEGSEGEGEVTREMRQS